MEHGFPGGPPQPPYGPPLQGRAPAVEDAPDGPPTGPPRDDVPPADVPPPDTAAPPAPPAGDGDDHADRAPAASWPADTVDDATPAADDVAADHGDEPTFAEVLAAQRALGRAAEPRHAPAPDDAPAAADTDDGLPAAPTPPPPPGRGRLRAKQDTGPVRRAGRWVRNLVVAGLVVLGLLAAIGFLIGEEEVDGAGEEGAFAPVATEQCETLIIEDPPAFVAGEPTQTDVGGDGLAGAVWQAPITDATRILDPVDVVGDGGDTVTVSLIERRPGGEATSHLAVYDTTTGALQDQLHLDARQLAAAGDAQWFVGVSGGSALLFPVTDATIGSCFAANAPTGSPSPPLTDRIDGQLRPTVGGTPAIAAAPQAAFVLARRDGEVTVQRLGRDGAVASVDDVGRVQSVHGDDTQLYLLVSAGLDANTVEAFDADTLDRRWRGELPDGFDVFGAERVATTDDTVTVTVRATGSPFARLDRDSGAVRATGELDGRVRATASDGTATYLVAHDEAGGDVSSVLRLDPDGSEATTSIGPPDLAYGAVVTHRTADAVAVSGAPFSDGPAGVLLQGGEVRATTDDPLVAVGAEHVVVLRWQDGELALLGVALDGDPAGGGDGDDQTEDEQTDDDPAEDGDDADDDSPQGGADGSEPDTDDAAGGTGPGGASGSGTGTTGGGGAGSSEVTEDADIDEEWLP